MLAPTGQGDRDFYGRRRQERLPFDRSVSNRAVPSRLLISKTVSL